MLRAKSFSYAHGNFLSFEEFMRYASDKIVESPLTNTGRYSIMKIKRELISRRFAPAVLVNRNNRHKFGDRGGYFCF